MSKTTKQRPVETLRDGAVKAAIWKNESEKGVFHAVTFDRTYKSADGELKDTDSYSGSQLLLLAHLAYKAYDRASELDRKARASDEAGADEEA